MKIVYKTNVVLELRKGESFGTVIMLIIKTEFQEKVKQMLKKGRFTFLLAEKYSYNLLKSS